MSSTSPEKEKNASGKAGPLFTLSRKKLFGGAAVQTGITACILVFLFVFFLQPFPELDTFLRKKGGPVVLDRWGRVLQLGADDRGEYRFPILFDEIPEHTLTTFILAEDKRFFFHGGVDFIGLYRALMDSLHAGKVVSGGSGITMQLSRMIAARGEGLWGKTVEIRNALRLEYLLSKEEILTLYLNSVPFGFNTRGLEAASYRYWGRKASSLTIPESVILAGIPRNPSSRNPVDYPKRSVEKALELAEIMGHSMERESLKKAVEEAGRGGEQWKEFLRGRAPHFLRYLAEKSKERGGDPERTSSKVYASGKDSSGDEYSYNSRSLIISSLDLELNKALEETIDIFCEMGGIHRVKNGAGILLHNRTGEILAYVGSRDFFGPQGQIDGVRMRRQPGSTLKPFLYALAFERGYLPCNRLPDLPMDFGGEFVYRPENFDSLYRGSVLLREALASSLNIPAVFLLEQIGVKEFENFLGRVGFGSITEQAGSMGVGLALGNGEVSLLELARGFSLFPRGGVFIEESLFLQEGNGKSKKGVSPYSAALICDILSDPRARETGFGRAELLRSSFPFMIKTGTSDRYQNIWAVGATLGFTAAVWFGSFTGETVVGITGSSLPAAVVKMVLEEAENIYPKGPFAGKSKEAEGFPIPRGVGRKPVCTETGELAEKYCPSRYYELLPLERTLPVCSVHSKEAGYLHSSLHIISPLHNSSYYIDPRIPAPDQRVKIEVRGGTFGGTVQLLVNGREVKKGETPLVYYLPLKAGDWSLEARSDTESKVIRFSVRSD